ncbi:sulfur carrier protein ThiS [Mariluticola halotolerans]|uniref:sulfur carrier protein ThiS n=1 Tax=Mariluticola halotolerans TaxID=2909283 RepID=UPI0026E17BB5|nr:sulfur carrier protein ThiS [Mariluticola halotolerans]UJQ94243.1 sulfur carrier protein ThiS [Mariluticola halotolerans]
MNITLNGAACETAATDLAAALVELGFADAVVATAVNGAFVPAAARGDFQLNSGDQIEVLAPMQGG